MNIMTRPYRQKRRAAARDQTRQRIVDAAIAVHQAKGVAATSMADIAARAGVGKVTVYRHFPDAAALLGACSGQYFQRHPFPDAEAWRQVADPVARLRRGLAETYAYHRETAPMMDRVLPEARDEPVVAPYHAHWRRAAEVLAEAWPERQRHALPLRAALALALEFDTWRLLVRDQGLTDAEAIALVERLMPEPRQVR